MLKIQETGVYQSTKGKKNSGEKKKLWDAKEMDREKKMRDREKEKENDREEKRETEI